MQGADARWQTPNAFHQFREEFLNIAEHNILVCDHFHWRLTFRFSGGAAAPSAATGC
jgi:hypothetical protein